MSYICLIGNKNGILAASDTRETFDTHNHRDNRQKVFKCKKQNLVWACCGLTMLEGKDYLRLVEFIMRDTATTLDQKLDYIYRSIKKATTEGFNRLGSGSAMDILIGHMGKRTMMIRMNISLGNIQTNTFFAPLALQGGSGKLHLPKMKLDEYNELTYEELKKYAHKRVENVIQREIELCAKNPQRAQTIGGHIITEGLKK